MKLPSFRALTLGAAIMVMAPGADAEAWQLVWSDEFDGPSLNTSNWSHEVNANGGGNNELQYYTARAANSFIRDGKLVIKAIKETFVGPEGTRGFTSARLRTVNKRDFTYGRMEARIKMPAGQGLWPAFWMLPTDWEYGGWPTSGEIDIMEFRGDQPTTLHGTIHYGGPLPAHTFTGTTIQTPGDLSTAFHDYAIEWEEGEIRWYFDGELYLTQNQWFSGGGTYPAPFDKRFHFLLNVAVGGNFLPNPPPDADYFPQEMEVDWVRVYQRATPVQQSAYPGPTPTLPARIEAENFDAGGQGVGSLDNTTANQGGAYRPEELVDIEPTTDTGGGHNIGWITPGEYLEYTVNVTTPGLYRLDARVAADNGPDTIEITITPSTGSPVTRTTNFNATGGFQTWQTVQAGEFPLPAGNAVIRFKALTNEFNFNWIEAIFVSPDPGPGTPAFEINFDNSPATGPTGGVIGCDWGFGNPFSSGNPITSFVSNAGGLAYNITGNLSNGGNSFSYVVFYVRTDPDVNTGRDFSAVTHLQFDARVNEGNNLAWNVRLEDSDGDPALEYQVDRVALSTLNATFQTIKIPVSEFTDGNNGVPVNMEALRAIAIFADGGPNTQTATLTPRLTIDNLMFLVPPTVHPGDADGDGVLTVADVTAIHNLLSGADPSPLPGSGDANGDGLVNIADADLIVDHLVNATPLP